MKFPRYCRLSGFSLSELLLVIGIVVILIGLIVPVTISVRRSQQVVQCMNQQRQIGVATLLYAADHQGKLPPFIQGGETLSSTGNQFTLANQLIPPRGNYLPGPEVFGDPGALDRIYERKSNGRYKWANGQDDRSGYWHIYMSPKSDHNPQRAADSMYGANDTVQGAPYKVIMHCYHAAILADCAHARGEVNVLRLDGSVSTYTRSQYRPGRAVLDNFDHVRP